jgi:hypothetical protein
MNQIRIGDRMRLAQKFIFLSWLVTGELLAGSMTAELDQSTGVEGDQFTLTFRVEGNHETAPSFPPIPGLSVSSAGNSTSVSISNGQYSKETGYTFVLVPEKAGTFTIPSVVLKIDGQDVATLPLSLRVEAVAKGEQAAEAGEPIFIKREFSNMHPYVGESVVETVRVYHKVSIQQAAPSSTNSPEFRFFPIEGEAHSREQIGAETYEVITLNKVLVPLSAGDKAIPAFGLDTVLVMPSTRRTRNDFFGSVFGGGRGELVRRSVSSGEATIAVKPIPEENRPADYKGLVGSFKVKAELNKRQLKVGETTTLTLTIGGEGLLDRFKEPELNLGKQFKVYADKADVKEQATAARGVLGQKIFKFALVPTQAGTIELQDFKLSVFDPKQGIFVPLIASLGSVSVEGSEAENVVVVSGNGETTVTGNKAGVKSLAKDIIDLHRHIQLSESNELSSQDTKLLMLIGTMPGGLALVGFVLRGWRRRTGGDRSTQRRSRAYRTFKTSIQPGTNGVVASLSVVYDAYRTLLGDKLGLQGKAMTLKEIRETLSKKQLPAELQFDAVALAEEMERILYSGNVCTAEDSQRIHQRVLKLASEVDRQC